MTYYEVYAGEPGASFYEIVEELVRAGKEHQLIFDRKTVERMAIANDMNPPIVTLVVDEKRYLIGDLKDLQEHL